MNKLIYRQRPWGPLWKSKGTNLAMGQPEPSRSSLSVSYDSLWRSFRNRRIVTFSKWSLAYLEARALFNGASHRLNQSDFLSSNEILMTPDSMPLRLNKPYVSYEKASFNHETLMTGLSPTFSAFAPKPHTESYCPFKTSSSRSRNPSQSHLCFIASFNPFKSEGGQDFLQFVNSF